MLIDEHSDGDARHVEAVEEVLNRCLNARLDEILRLLQLQNAIGHGLYNVSVSIANVNERSAELLQVLAGRLRFLKVNHFLEAFRIPIADQTH